MILNHEQILYRILVIDTKNPLIGTFLLLVCRLVGGGRAEQANQ